MKISVVDSQKKIKLDHRMLKAVAGSVLEKVGEKAAELSIYIVDDAEIRRLNYRYLGHDRPTDVLAFSMKEGEDHHGSEGILGDVVISTETAAMQAKRYKKHIKEEIVLYLVHGILHLAGYDDTTAAAKKKMERMQRMILLGVT